jgi:hypothetical protein
MPASAEGGTGGFVDAMRRRGIIAPLPMTARMMRVTSPAMNEARAVFPIVPRGQATESFSLRNCLRPVSSSSC